MIIVRVFATFLFMLALATIPAQEWGASQFANSRVTGTSKRPDLPSMGPDPGGHTGSTVTPQTTKTGQPAVDKARETASGAKTQSGAAPVDGAGQPARKN